MTKKTMRQAIGEALKEEMERDPLVFLLGEEVGSYDGAYKVSKGLMNIFGPSRIIDAPISEGGFAGLGVGAALTGLRPVIEFMSWNFAFQAFDQIINHAAKMRYMSGGQFSVPLVYRGPHGPVRGVAAQHSQSVESFLAHVPGLKVVVPSFPGDAKGLLKSAIRDNNPVVFLESESLYGYEGPVEEGCLPLGKGDIKKSGKDVTVITWGRISHKVLDLVKTLDLDVEVLDPRTLYPLDKDLIRASVKKTHRVVIVEESWPFASVGAQIGDWIQREAFDDLDAPILRVSQECVPVPFSPSLEELALPREEKIIKAIREVCYAR